MKLGTGKAYVGWIQNMDSVDFVANYPGGKKGTMSIGNGRKLDRASSNWRDGGTALFFQPGSTAVTSAIGVSFDVKMVDSLLKMFRRSLSGSTTFDINAQDHVQTTTGGYHFITHLCIYADPFKKLYSALGKFNWNAIFNFTFHGYLDFGGERGQVPIWSRGPNFDINGSSSVDTGGFPLKSDDAGINITERMQDIKPPMQYDTQ